MKKTVVFSLILGLLGLFQQSFGAEAGPPRRERARTTAPLTLQKTWETINEALDTTEYLQKKVRQSILQRDIILTPTLYDLRQNITKLNNGTVIDIFSGLNESIDRKNRETQINSLGNLKKQLLKLKNYVTTLAIQESDMGQLLPEDIAKLVASFGTE